MSGKQTQNFVLREGKQKDIKSLWAMAEDLRNNKEFGYFEQQWEQQQEGKRLILIASLEGEDAGYCLLNWHPKYGYFKAMDMPEIQDLNVLKRFRQQGIGRKLIEHCEKLAVAKGYAAMGISFGLSADYGPAQRLYVKMGYIPDGFGVTYDRKTVVPGEFKPIDDQLCLMMTKNLPLSG